MKEVVQGPEMGLTEEEGELLPEEEDRDDDEGTPKSGNWKAEPLEDDAELEDRLEGRAATAAAAAAKALALKETLDDDEEESDKERKRKLDDDTDKEEGKLALDSEDAEDKLDGDDGDDNDDTDDSDRGRKTKLDDDDDADTEMGPNDATEAAAAAPQQARPRKYSGNDPKRPLWLPTSRPR
jgi:hypothetical protein